MTCRAPGLPAAGGTAKGEMPQTEPCQCDSMTGARPTEPEDSSARPTQLTSGRDSRTRFHPGRQTREKGRHTSS